MHWIAPSEKDSPSATLEKRPRAAADQSMNAKPTSATSPNPNGIASLSPGLARSDYPGWALMNDTTPTGLRKTQA